MLQIKDHGQDVVQTKVVAFLTKCSNQLGLSFNPDFIKTLSEDIIDKYRYESLEDIAECIKKGRQGYYGTSYNKLNMMVISEWMHQHLDAKGRAREKIIQNKFQTSKEPLAKVDYEAFKKRIADKKPKIGKLAKKDLDKYIEDVCNAMQVDSKELFNGSQKKEVADVRGVVKSFQSNNLKMTREQIKEYWDACSD